MNISYVGLFLVVFGFALHSIGYPVSDLITVVGGLMLMMKMEIYFNNRRNKI